MGGWEGMTFQPFTLHGQVTIMVSLDISETPGQGSLRCRAVSEKVSQWSVPWGGGTTWDNLQNNLEIFSKKVWSKVLAIAWQSVLVKV